MKRHTDKEHLHWVSTLPCTICNTKNNIQVHHLLKPYNGYRGLSLRSGDDNVLPLCMYHHTELHTKFGDEEKFFVNYGLEESYGRTMAKRLYEAKSRWVDEDDDCPF